MRQVTPLAIEVLLDLYCGTPIPNYPAQIEILRDFQCDGLSYIAGGLTPTGKEWAERVLSCLPPRGYGGKSPGYWIIGAHPPALPAYGTIEHARRDVMACVEVATSRNFADYLKGGYILKAIELLEPNQPVEPNFQTTYLS